MTYTVKQLAKLAGVSARTLHYYDEIGLLKPETVGENGYRYYSRTDLLRLQQILFYKELDFSLQEIGEMLEQPGFDLREALESHRLALRQRVERLQRLIGTVDQTLLHLEGRVEMDDKQIFSGWSEEKQKGYEQEIRERYGERAFEGVTDWNSYTPEQKEAIKAESAAIYQALGQAMDKGPGSPEAQALVARWHNHLRYFYEPSLDRLRGLAEMYTQDERFRANFEKVRPGLTEFMKEAIEVYVGGKEGNG